MLLLHIIRPAYWYVNASTAMRPQTPTLMSLCGRQTLLLLVTLQRGVAGSYYVDVPVDTPAGAAVTAVVMTLVVVAVLSYFYSQLKEQAGSAAGQFRSIKQSFIKG